MFSALPFAAASEIQNTNVNQNTSVTNAVTDQGLKIGTDGKYVVKLQKWLKNQGYYTGNIDGSFGPYTEEAVKFFQNDSDIIVDGWVANQTVCAMEDLNGVNIFEEISESSSSTSSSDIKTSSTTYNDVKSSSTTSTSDKNTTNSTVKKSTSTTKKSTTTTKTSVSKKTSTTSSSTKSQILASGAKYGYSHSASTASAMMACGSGDCWAMSDYLYSRLSSAGIDSRIVQYSTAYSSRHRSVQLYENGRWVDVPYSSYGYSTMFKATSSKPGMTVIAS
jgi:N-acetylmuramoyl-L-alanine amidase